MNLALKPLFAVYLLLLASACANDGARETVLHDAGAAGMTRVEIATGGFTLTSYQRITATNRNIRVYIEGDGFAWITANQPSADPTPIHATALALAALDTASNVVYLARPCQYSMQQSPQCNAAYWAGKRFSAEAVTAMDNALNEVMRAAPGQKMELVGYSGGAAIAVMLAARRSDVASLRTVAGNLDDEAVNRYHHVSAMPESLNPIDFAVQIRNLPQRHFYGGKDTVIPAFVPANFVERQHGSCAQITAVPEANHLQGWEVSWMDLLMLPVECR